MLSAHSGSRQSVHLTRPEVSLSIPKSAAPRPALDKVFRLLIGRQEVRSNRSHSCPLFCSSTIEAEVSANSRTHPGNAAVSAHTGPELLVFRALKLRFTLLAWVATC